MNHDQFRKCIGQTLRLEPAAIGPDGKTADDDWTVVESDPDRKAALLRNRTRGGDLMIGFDHVKNYDSDPQRGDGCGFLNMLWQVRIARDGRITARPIAARAAAPPAPEFHPVVVNDGQTERHLTWAQSGDPVHLIPEGEPRQLMATYVGVCDALRAESKREPQFDAPNAIRHEIVWELTPDHRSKHKLLGGMGGQAGTAVLVLTDKKAQPVQSQVTSTEPAVMQEVEQNFPERSGLQKRLNAEGFILHWVHREKAARRRSEGWEVVVAVDGGRRVEYRDRSGCVLMKRRE